MACTLESVWEFRSPNICWFIFKLYFNLLRIWLLLCLLLMLFLCASHMTMLQEAQGWPLFVRFFTDISSQSSSVLDHERDYFYPTTHFYKLVECGVCKVPWDFFMYLLQYMLIYEQKYDFLSALMFLLLSRSRKNIFAVTVVFIIHNSIIERE